MLSLQARQAEYGLDFNLHLSLDSMPLHSGKNLTIVCGRPGVVGTERDKGNEHNYKVDGMACKAVHLNFIFTQDQYSLPLHHIALPFPSSPLTV